MKHELRFRNTGCVPLAWLLRLVCTTCVLFLLFAGSVFSQENIVRDPECSESCHTRSASGLSQKVHGTGKGSEQTFLKKPTPKVFAAKSLLLPSADRRDGPTPQEKAGHSVLVAEFNDDAYPDLIVGAPGHQAGEPSGLNLDSSEHRGPKGKVLVYFGSENGPAETPSLTLTGKDASDRFGTVIKTGDMNGDGKMDLVVSALYGSGMKSRHSGCVYIFYGPFSEGEMRNAADADVMVSGQFYREHFGLAMEIGDFDGDGMADLVVGADFHTPFPTDSSTRLDRGLRYIGATYFYRSPVSMMTNMPVITMGDKGGDHYGDAMLNVGNLDPAPDTADELIVWASAASPQDDLDNDIRRSGIAYVLSWDLAKEEWIRRRLLKGNSLPDSSRFTFLGRGSPAMLDDMNGDGLREIAMPTHIGLDRESFTGSVYLINGDLLALPEYNPDDLSTIKKITDPGVSVAAISGVDEEDQFGVSATGIGDVNEDGVPDVAVGAPGADGRIGPIESTLSGAVYILSGKALMDPANNAHSDVLKFQIEADYGQIVLGELVWKGSDAMGQAVTSGDFDNDPATKVQLVAGAPENDGQAHEGTNTKNDIPGSASNRNSGAVFIQSF